MGRRFSITNDPDFRWIIFVIDLLVVSAVYVGFKNGGIVSGIISGLQALWNIGYATFWVAILIAIIIYAFFKWRIIGTCLVQIAKWIWSFISRKKR
jgi:hypothetical protein